MPIHILTMKGTEGDTIVAGETEGVPIRELILSNNLQVLQNDEIQAIVASM